MNHTTLIFRRQKLFVLLLLRVGILGMIMLRRSVASEDQIGVPDTGLLCISDCATCPVICSPPPPKHSYTPNSPPITLHSPPQSCYHSPPPPAQSPPPPQKLEPPSSSWVMPPPAPPPPFKYNNNNNNNNMPPGQGPPIPGQHDYPYPYYYFYASKASIISSHASILLVILFYSVVLFFC